MEPTNKYNLDLHCQMILEEYHEQQAVFEKIRDVGLDGLRRIFKENDLRVTAIDSRIKTEESLAGKLERKGNKYATLSDITDIVGLRIIAFYNDEVDKISALVEGLFEIDWNNSVDKRRMHDIDRFGYNSLHYICRIPKSLYFDPENPAINELRFEIQMRTTLQHMWASMYHYCGYKSGIEVPQEYLRTLNRLAGMLELADDEFSRIRTAITNYRRRINELVESGNFDEVNLDGDSFKSYLKFNPFDSLNQRIAAINQSEIMPASIMPYYEIFCNMGLKTLGDVDRMVKENSEDAYLMAVRQLGKTDLNIISSTVAVQNLCIVHILKSGKGIEGLVSFFDTLYGESDGNRSIAEQTYTEAIKLPFMIKNR